MLDNKRKIPPLQQQTKTRRVLMVSSANITLFLLLLPPPHPIRKKTSTEGPITVSWLGNEYTSSSCALIRSSDVANGPTRSFITADRHMQALVRFFYATGQGSRSSVPYRNPLHF